MERKIVYFIFIAILLGCNKTKEENRNDIFLEVNNSQLKEEILIYKDYMEKKGECNDCFIHVYYYSLNDSTLRFVLNCETTKLKDRQKPYHFKLKIDNLVVYFTDLSLIDPIYPNKNSFFYFSFKEEEVSNLNKSRNKSVGGELEVVEFRDNELCFLTFVRDSLISKTLQPGSIYDRVAYQHQGSAQ